MDWARNCLGDRQIFHSPPAVFEVVKDIRISAKKRQHQMAMRDFDDMAPRPSFSDRMQSTKPTPFALPVMPKLPLDQAMPLEPDTVLSDVVWVRRRRHRAGLWVRARGQQVELQLRYEILRDQGPGPERAARDRHLDSMFSRVKKGQNYRFNFKTIKEETVKLIDGLNINALFNIVIYEGGAMAFSGQEHSGDRRQQGGGQGMGDEPGRRTNFHLRPAGQGPKLMKGGGTRLDTAIGARPSR